MTADQQAQRLSVARTMIESGLSPATVALRLQVRFSISRATAYRDVTAAGLESDASDDGPGSEELAGGADGPDLVAELLYDARRCLAAGDYANATKLIAAADKAKRWAGQGQPESGWA